MKLSDKKGQEAFDAFIALSGPIFEISGDPELYELVNNGVTMLEWINSAIKGHRAAFVQVLALLNGEDAETYGDTLTFSDILKGVNELFSDPLLVNLFLPQVQKKSKGKKKSSGPATGNTEENQK